MQLDIDRIFSIAMYKTNYEHKLKAACPSSFASARMAYVPYFACAKCALHPAPGTSILANLEHNSGGCFLRCFSPQFLISYPYLKKKIPMTWCCIFL